MGEMMSEAIGDLAAALAAVQAKIRPALKDTVGQIGQQRGYKYADLNAVWDAARAALAENGLAVAQATVILGPDGNGDPAIAVETRLVHRSGQWMSGQMPVIYGKEERGLKPMQMMGSALTYARRYGLAAMLGVVADEDDDGASSAQDGDDRRGYAGPPRGGNGNGGGRGGAPRDGRALFAWLKDEQARHAGVKLIEFASGWGQRRSLPEKLIDWPAEAVADCHGAIVAKLAEKSGAIG